MTEQPRRKPVRYGGRKLTVSGRPVELTGLEFALMRRLRAGRGRIVSRDQLLKAGWPEASPRKGNVVEVAILSLRRKLGRGCSVIETVRGAGYRYNPR